MSIELAKKNTEIKKMEIKIKDLENKNQHKEKMHTKDAETVGQLREENKKLLVSIEALIDKEENGSEHNGNRMVDDMSYPVMSAE